MYLPRLNNFSTKHISPVKTAIPEMIARNVERSVVIITRSEKERIIFLRNFYNYEM